MPCRGVDLLRPGVTPTECSLMSSVSACLRSASASVGRLAVRDRSPLWIQIPPNLDVASVDIRAKLQPVIAIRERGLVRHEYRHGLWRSALSGVTGRDRLIDCIDRLLHQQGGQLQGILDPDASMTD